MGGGASSSPHSFRTTINAKQETTTMSANQEQVRNYFLLFALVIGIMQLNAKLFDSAVKGSLARATTALQQKANVNSKHGEVRLISICNPFESSVQDGMPAIVAAAGAGHLPIVASLIEDWGADIESRDNVAFFFY